MSNLVFSDYATSTAFSVSLSKNMIGMLAIIGQGYSNPVDTTVRFSHSVVAGRALENRGLIEPISEHLPQGMYQLTRAGQLMHDLCVEAGVINNPRVPNIDYSEAIQVAKNAEKSGRIDSIWRGAWAAKKAQREAGGAK